MPLLLERQDPHWLVRLDGHVTLASAAELKTLLLDWVSARKNLELDLDRAEEVDLAIMQLLWAAATEASRSGLEVTGHASEKAMAAFEDSGFQQMPGLRFRCQPKSPPRRGSA